MGGEGGNIAGSCDGASAGVGAGAEDGADGKGAAGMTAADLSYISEGPFARLRLAGII